MNYSCLRPSAIYWFTWRVAEGILILHLAVVKLVVKLVVKKARSIVTWRVAEGILLHHLAAVKLLLRTTFYFERLRRS